MAEPRFNLEDVSRRWAKDWLLVNMQIQRSTALLQSEVSEKASPEERQRVNQAQLEAMESMPELIQRQEQMLAEVLVDVPREWLTPKAPEKLDWSNPESFGWMRDKRFNDVLAALAAERQKQQDDSKN